MSVIYRDALDKDLPFILEIIKSVSGDYKDIAPERFLIAEGKNKIIGCIRIKKAADSFELASLAVSPEYRSKGIGSNLVAKILKRFNNRPVYLLCAKEKESFYEKFGFKMIEVENIPESLKKDYYNFLNLKFAKNPKLLLAMILV